MRAYLKSSLPCRGVTNPLLHQLCRLVFAAHPLSSFEDWHATIVALWDHADYREDRFAALELVGYRAYESFRTLEALPLYERLVVDGAWWDLVDGLATHEVGDLLRRYPERMGQVLLEWSRGADPWLRRASIICQVGFKGSTDQQLLYACIEPSLGERDFFLRKAIGWALREHSKVAPDAVRDYVAAHATELSPLSRREGMKYVPEIAGEG